MLQFFWKIKSASAFTIEYLRDCWKIWVVLLPAKTHLDDEYNFPAGRYAGQAHRWLYDFLILNLSRTERRASQSVLHSVKSRRRAHTAPLLSTRMGGSRGLIRRVASLSRQLKLKSGLRVREQEILWTWKVLSSWNVVQGFRIFPHSNFVCFSDLKPTLDCVYLALNVVFLLSGVSEDALYCTYELFHYLGFRALQIS